MALNDPLLSSPPQTSTYELIQSLFFMLAFSTGLGILGSTYTLSKFQINSLLANFLFMLLILLTYLISHHMIAYCCRESSKKYNFAEYLEDHFGKFAAMTYDVLLTMHNIILLAYIQFFVAHFMVESNTSEGNADRAYYFLAVVNIPLILVSLIGDFRRNKWFCVGMLVAWVYVFAGKIVETGVYCSGEEYWDEFPVEESDEFGVWVVKLVGLQLYFASAFQSVPFIYKEVKGRKLMNKVINWGAVWTLVVYVTVYIFYTFDPSSSVERDEEESDEIESDKNTTVKLVETVISCKSLGNYKSITDYGRVLIGACGIVINVIPARFALAQFLSGNNADTMQKLSASDKLLSGVLIILSIILSLFMFNQTIWNITVGFGVILSSILGILVPTLATLFTEEYSKLLFPSRPQKNRTNKNKFALLQVSDLGKKIFIYTYLSWTALFTLLGVSSGLLIMIDI